MTDLIVYQVITKPGGVDGLDHTDKGGTVVNASFDKAAMTEKYGRDCRYRIEPTVIDLGQTKEAALAKLTRIEKLALFGSKGRP